jgi:hypothetical protein
MRSIWLVGSLVAIAVLSGCGGSSSSSNGGGNNPVAVSVSPATATLKAGATQQFTATVTNASNTAVTWTVSPATAGTISGSGLYTAPSSVTSQITATVTATSQADATKSASATVTLQSGSITVSVKPTTAQVDAGFTQQFTAIVTNTTQTAVTWAVSPPTAGTIDSSGLYTAAATGSGNATVTATSQVDSTKSGTAAVTINALTGIAVSPLGPAVTVGGSQQFAATGTFTGDPNPHDVTALSTWASSITATATVSTSGLATGAAPGVTTITATDGTPNGSTALNVTTMTMTNLNLNGHYAFFLTNAGTRGPSYTVASFAADGTTGTLTGIEDINATTGSTPPAGLPITGTFNIYPDGRGTLTLKSKQATNVFRITLSNDGPPSTRAQVIELDNHGVEVGTLELQDSNAFSTALSGPYAFLLGGVDGTILSGTLQNVEDLAAQFVVTSGTINGNLDVNNNGTSSGPLPFVGTVGTTIDGNGRGTLALTLPSQVTSNTGPTNFAYYIVSASKILLVQTDLQPNSTAGIPALAGKAETQPNPHTFTNADLAGAYTFLLERGAASGIFGVAGEWTFTASNTFSGEMDINNVGITNLFTIPSGTYASVAANGRAVVTVSATRAFVIYLISPSAKMYVLETDPVPATQSKINGGVAEQQTNNNALLNGTLDFALAQLATAGNDSSFSGQLITSGSNLSGIEDSNISISNVESQASTILTGNWALDSGTCTPTVPTCGRGSATLGTTPYRFYLLSPTKLIIFGLKSAFLPYQAFDGVIENQ